MLKILLLEDQKPDAELAVRALRSAGIEVECQRVRDEAGFRAALASAPDIVISDGRVPGFPGLAALALVKAEAPGTPFIVLSGDPWDYRAQEAIAAGASDYVCKADLRALAPAVLRALEARNKN
jgi:CheY-like chemotaxis protein